MYYDPDAYFMSNLLSLGTAFLYTAGRLFKYDVICSQVAGTIQTNRMIPSMTRYAAATRSRRCPRESEPLACLKFESKQRVIFPLATVAMAYWEHAEYKLLL